MAGAGSCLNLWREENDGLARRWRRVTQSPGSGCSVTQTAQQCRLGFTKLLQKIQGLPAALPALPMELTILYNSLLFDIHLASNSGEKLLAMIDHELSRVLEACAESAQGLVSEDRWQKVLQEETPEELKGPLHRLAALQGALWLAANSLGRAEGLFQLLSGAKSLRPPPLHGCQNDLLSLLQAWHPPDVGESDPLVAQNVRDLKDILWTSAAFLQGFQELEAGSHLPAALALLQAAATGLCSKRVLAQIFTLMGCCNQKMGKPQMAIQYLKRALQVDFTFLPALHQAALLYRQLGLTEAELEALVLLYQALDGPVQATTVSVNPHLLVQTELLICAPTLAAFFVQKCPSEVKYVLAQRCLQAGRAGEAVEHYLDLLALLQEGPLKQMYPALPRIPEVFLEAASALQELARHQDAIAVCEEVVTRTSELVPERLRIDLGARAEEDTPETAGSSLATSPDVITERKRESLRLLHHLLLLLAMEFGKELCRVLNFLLLPLSYLCRLERCLNDLLRVHFENTAGSSAEEETEQVEVKVLSQIRQLALTARGTQFLELEQDKEALMDFQHSLHVCPGDPTANLYLLHTLWKLDRRQEAAARWQTFHSAPVFVEGTAERTFPLHLLSCMKQMTFPHMESLTRNMERCLEGGSQGP